MMTLRLGYLADPVHKSESGLEIGELVGTHEVMFIDDFPLRGLRQLLMNLRELASLQWRDSAAAGNAISVCKREFAHNASLLERAPRCARLGRG